MAIDFKKKSYSGSFPRIWRGEAKIMPAGYKPVNTINVGDVLHRGTLLHVETETLTAAVVKSAEVLNGSTSQNLRVNKDSYFSVGDKISNANGTGIATIQSIDTSNDGYDVLVCSAALSGAKPKDILFEAEEAAKPKYEPNAVVGAELEYTGKGIPTIDAAYECVVLKTPLAQPLVADWLNGFCLKSNPSIKFFKQ